MSENTDTTCSDDINDVKAPLTPSDEIELPKMGKAPGRPRSDSKRGLPLSPRMSHLTPRQRLQRALQHVRIAVRWRKIAITVQTPEVDMNVPIEDLTKEELQERINVLRRRIYELNTDKTIELENRKEAIAELQEQLRELDAFYRAKFPVH